MFGLDWLEKQLNRHQILLTNGGSTMNSSSWIWIREEKSWWDRLYINVHSTHAEWSEKYIWPTFDAWSPVCHTVSVSCDPEADERLNLLLCQGMRWKDRCDGGGGCHQPYTIPVACSASSTNPVRYGELTWWPLTPAIGSGQDIALNCRDNSCKKQNDM
jgi:hypothetical protein